MTSWLQELDHRLMLEGVAATTRHKIVAQAWLTAVRDGEVFISIPSVKWDGQRGVAVIDGSQVSSALLIAQGGAVAQGIDGKAERVERSAKDKRQRGRVGAK